MENDFFRKKLFIKELTFLAKEMVLAVKNANPKEKKNHKILLKKYIKAIQAVQKGIRNIKKDLPPAGNLDSFFESVIEKSKLAETKPTIENRQDYKNSLEGFIKAYDSSSDKEKQLWKEAFDEAQIEHKKVSDKLTVVLAVKNRVDNLEKTESAKVYCIVKGKNSDGSEWGRIDFVGRNYVMKNKDKVSKGANTNQLPLVVKYYSFQDGSYTHLKDSNKLEAAFDKQLMDIFLKSGCTSYELDKNFDRDYEYHPKLAQVIGKGNWYVNFGKPNTPERIAKVIEVPDWNEFGFTDLFDKYLDDCGNAILTNTAGDDLKDKMKKALEQQEALIEELKAFHVNENNGDKDTEILIEVWNKRKRAFQKAMETELKNDCIPAYNPPEPCIDFDPIYKEHVDKCTANALPKRIGDVLKKQMQECIDNSKSSLNDMEAALEKFKKIPNWEKDTATKQKVDDLQKEIDDRTQKNEQQEKDLAALPEQCLKPIPLEITFESSTNSIAGKDDKQLKEIAQFLIDYPETKIKLTGNTSISESTSVDKEFGKNTFTETVETDHIMPDDVLPTDLTQVEVDSMRNRLLTPKDLMMIRAEGVKQLFVSLGVSKNQIETAPGKNLGEPESNQKVILEFY